MSVRKVFLMAVIASLLNACAPVSKEDKERNIAYERLDQQREEIYTHMQRYGINRDNVAALKHLYRGSPNIRLSLARFYKPGEHFRIEMEDEYILTMKIPQGKPDANWIMPYSDIHDPGMRKDGGLDIADLGWYTRPFLGTIEDRNSKGVHISYRVIKPEEEERYATPEKMLAHSTEWQKSQIITPADAEKEARRNPISIWVPTWFVVKPERVVINGRVWIRDGMSDWRGRPAYRYSTILKPGRRLAANFSLPIYNYLDTTDPQQVLTLPVYTDPRTAASSYPEPIREAIARMDEMVASLRIAKIKDDGAPDPFVIERVKPAPLPVREPLPAAQPR
ncbi:MAG: hypothetical protein FWG52_00780, partial [Proteobacteria bacterium]|nr:hypothetical protein [Pseudomonadota bacterium]